MGMGIDPMTVIVMDEWLQDLDRTALSGITVSSSRIISVTVLELPSWLLGRSLHRLFPTDRISKMIPSTDRRRLASGETQ